MEMIEHGSSYVALTAEGSWRIAGSRVSLDSIVHAYWQGISAESIVAEFPTLREEQVHGAIAFYLRHRAEIDEYLKQQETRWHEVNERSEIENAPLLARLRAEREARKPE